jgi:hypothetical protein
MRAHVSIAFVAFLFLAAGTITAGENPYYYFRGEPHDLTIDTSKLFIKFRDIDVTTGLNVISQSYPAMSYDQMSQVQIDGFCLFDLMPGVSYDAVVSALQQEAYIKYVNPVFRHDDTHSAYVGETFICRFTQNTPKGLVDSLFATYHLEVDHENPWTPGEYTLRITDSTQFSVIDIANLFHGFNQAMYAHPNFYG